MSKTIEVQRMVTLHQITAIVTDKQDVEHLLTVTDSYIWHGIEVMVISKPLKDVINQPVVRVDSGLNIPLSNIKTIKELQDSVFTEDVYKNVEIYGHFENLWPIYAFFGWPLLIIATMVIEAIRRNG